MLQINMADVANILTICMPYLIALAVIVAANMICMGPMASMLTLVTGNGTITQEAGAARNLHEAL